MSSQASGVLPKLAHFVIDSVILALGLLVAMPFFLAMAAPFVGGL